MSAKFVTNYVQLKYLKQVFFDMSRRVDIALCAFVLRNR